MDAISIGAAGMVSAVQRFDASALQTASGTDDLASNLVGQTTSKLDFQASARVVKTADQMVGQLLDIFV